MKSLTAAAPAIFLTVLLASIAVENALPADTLADEDCIACHGRSELQSRQGISRFIDPVRYSKSSHATTGVGCTSCHEGIVSASQDAKIPHPLGLKPKCGECHEKVSKEYSQSIHAKVSEKICFSCHNPHYTISFRQMSGEARKNICLKCHKAALTHSWLPQRRLHFYYLECTACHALNAQVGMLFFIVDKNATSKENFLRYEQMSPLIAPGKKGLIETLDQDGNGSLSESELHSFMKRLHEKGFPGAALEVRMLVLNPSHNFSSRGEQARDCTLCHSEDAKFYSTVLLEVPEEDGFRTIPVEKGMLARPGRRLFLEDFYLLGESKIRKDDFQEIAAVVNRIGFKWIDLIGCFAVFFVSSAVVGHMILMGLTKKFRRPRTSEVEPLPVAIRVWHWLHGLCVVLLVLTGLQLRLPDVAPIFATFLNAVNLHNLCGAVVTLDFIFWVSYHAWRKEFKTRFFISPVAFLGDIAETLHYYGYLIFVGKPFPSSCQQYTIFDPLERVFFLTDMLVFVPVQILSGMLMYDVHTTMPLVQALGGLRVVDAIHLFFGYMLISSMIVHVYLHTLRKYRLRGR